MAALGEFVGEPARALGRPQQHPLGIAARVVLDEFAEHLKHRGVAVLGRRPARARLAHASRLKRLLVKLAQPLAHRVFRQPARPSRRRDPPVTECSRLRRRERSSLTLVELRGHQPVALRDR